MLGTKYRERSIQDEFHERKYAYTEFLHKYKIQFEELLSPLRGCMNRLVNEPMGESAHGYMLTPLRGGVHWDREFQNMEASGAESDS